MNLPDISKGLRRMYTDRMDIYDYEDSTDESGGDTVVLGHIPTVENIPCRISFTTPDSSGGAKIDVNPSRVELKIFAGLNPHVQKGSFIVARRCNSGGATIAEYQGNAGLPAVYSSHMEFCVIQEGKA